MLDIHCRGTTLVVSPSLSLVIAAILLLHLSFLAKDFILLSLDLFGFCLCCLVLFDVAKGGENLRELGLEIN